MNRAKCRPQAKSSNYRQVRLTSAADFASAAVGTSRAGATDTALSRACDERNRFRDWWQCRQITRRRTVVKRTDRSRCNRNTQTGKRTCSAPEPAPPAAAAAGAGAAGLVLIGLGLAAGAGIGAGAALACGASTAEAAGAGAGAGVASTLAAAAATDAEGATAGDAGAAGAAGTTAATVDTTCESKRTIG